MVHDYNLVISTGIPLFLEDDRNRNTWMQGMSCVLLEHQLLMAALKHF
jgi:hypothetical protein